MTATFLLIRHGAHGDLDRILSGRRPGVPLTEAGRAQAAATGAYLRGEPVTRIQCSPIERTRETAAIVADALGLPEAEPVDALLEIDFGQLTGRTFDSLHGDPAWDEWNNQRATAQVPGGERMPDVVDRVAAHLRATAASHPGELIALVTHADVVKAAVVAIFGLELQKMHAFDIGPASVTRMVVGDWGGRVLSINEKAGG